MTVRALWTVVTKERSQQTATIRAYRNTLTAQAYFVHSQIDATMALFDRIIDKGLLTRRINLVACNVIKEEDVPESKSYEQLSTFDTEETTQSCEDDEKTLEKERALQEAMLTIKHKFGKNAVLKGTNFTEGATAKERNRTIGGHKA